MAVNMEAEPLPKKSVDVADVESTNDGDHTIVAETARVLDHEAEKKLCRKFDTRILPFLSVMCKFPLPIKRNINDQGDGDRQAPNSYS